MEQERMIDLEQQKIIFAHITKIMKNRIEVLENQRNIASYALAAKIASESGTKTLKKRINLRTICCIAICTIMASGSVIAITQLKSDEVVTPFKTRYMVENLNGDTVDTWKFWKIDAESTLVVNIVNSGIVDERKIKSIKDAILSTDKIIIDDSITHKGLGTSSTYFAGWRGALEESSMIKTEYAIPIKFKIIESESEIGNIIIKLSTLKDQDGYSGFTKSTVDGNEILKSQIIIYDADGISDEGLAAIVRHEFGHAIGLGHSTAPEDLMAPTINMQIPYISECDTDAVSQLYDGVAMDKTVCMK
ncbi:matrixin family metalloprotease [Candidatus Nitrosotenuis chungbukensis]|uniref:matrixin family metalloprotease n=2 Tax=Candidatus Nitrosotenuis chungbukensis TaxID=1353246 RepID=UPI000693C090|nr:matrixin family metalloprotease [Candidatus Nitrosotenuis chungbukensis]